MRRLMSRLQRVLPRAGAVADVVLLSGSTAVGQVVVILASPILARLYTPEDFGTLGVIASLLGIISVIASLRYQLAIPIPEDDEEASQLVVASAGIVLLFSGITVLLMHVWGDIISLWLNIPRQLLVIIPVGTFLIGLYQVFYYWNVRAKNFKTIARTRVGQTATMVGIQLAGYSLGAWGLVLGHISGQMAGITTLIWESLRGSRFRLGRISLSKMWSSLFRYRRFPLLSTWEGIFNVLGMQLPPLLIASFFGSGAAGIYALSHRISNAPLQLAGKAVGDVFFSRAAVAHREGRLGVVVRETVERSISFALPPFLVLVSAGPTLFALVFGDEWRQAGVVARYLASWMFLVFVASPLTLLFSVLEKQRQGAIFQSTLLAARVLALLLGSRRGDLNTAVMLYVGVSVSFWVAFLLWSLKMTGNTISVLWTALLPAFRRLLPALLGLASALVLESLYNNDVVILAGVGVACLWMVKYYWDFVNTLQERTMN